MKLDFVVKPLNIYKIQNVIRKAASSAKHYRPNPAARSSRRSQFKFKPIAAIQYLKSKIMKGIGHNLFTWLHRQKNHLLIQETGQAISKILDVDRIIDTVVAGMEYILKPIVMNKLAEIVRSVLDGG